MAMFGKSKNTNNSDREASDKDTKKGMGKKRGGNLWLNIIGIIVVSVILVFLTLGWLKIYTRHYNSVEVPALRGMSVEDARTILDRVNLKLEVVDSIYNESLVPGAIIETTPSEGAVIKDRRTIYAVINNMSVKQAVIPDVYEISRRQAEAVIRRAGFTDLTIEYVMGEFSNLALRIKNNRGQILLKGDTIPFNEPLILEVSSEELLNDSLRIMNDSLMQIGRAIDTTTDHTSETTTDANGESWF